MLARTCERERDGTNGPPRMWERETGKAFSAGVPAMAVKGMYEMHPNYYHPSMANNTTAANMR
uniref:Uncharacterized protein n=1 Tax=Anopheles minimus TaxID=112268 RepID=A0A182WK63_9DIPT